MVTQYLRREAFVTCAERTCNIFTVELHDSENQVKLHETNKQTNTPTEVSLEPQLCMFTVALRQFQFLADYYSQVMFVKSRISSLLTLKRRTEISILGTLVHGVKCRVLRASFAALFK